jgi:hypothetical protein
MLADNAENQTHRNYRQERKNDVNVQEVGSGKEKQIENQNTREYPRNR